MNKQRTLDESVTVNRPVDEVFAYVAEFSRIEEWDPAVKSARKLTAGAPGVGTRFQVDMKAGFSLSYEIVEFEPDARLLMTVRSRFFDAREEILFESAKGGGTTVRYIATFDFSSPLSGLDSAFPGLMDRVGKSAMRGLQEALQDDFDSAATTRRSVLPGLWRFSKLGYAASRKRFRPMAADLRDRHMVITGATSGLGLATARALAARGAGLTLVVRDEKRGAKLVEDLQAESGNDDIALQICDMEIMSEVSALADRLLQQGRPVDVLVNNAGALFNTRAVTREGLERSFALLLLAPFILTEKLHPLLAAAGGARVINVSSGGMYTQKIHLDDLQFERGKYAGPVAYARAKRGLVIISELWAEKWRDDGIVVNAMHPGWADTPGVEQSLPGFHRLTRAILRTPEEGADTIVWLAAATEAAQVSGKFWLDREQHPTHALRRTRETGEEREELMAELQELMVALAPARKRQRKRKAS
ncbi:MAG: SDR family NAD(P)-dependent oxidoreductase [Halioglobus sp.]|nr:SDR family NAD(P)-dependent oxidoreductase [Halioglobus sp.]